MTDFSKLWWWDAERGRRVGAADDFTPAPAEMRMLNREMPPLSDAEAAAAMAHGEAGSAALLAYLDARHKRVWDARRDPFRHGWELPHWPVIRQYIRERDEIYIFGANDSAKTKLLARVVVGVLTGNIKWPNMMAGAPKVLCIAQNDTVSKQIQQSAVFEELPVEYRRWNDRAQKKRSATMKVNYSQADGFTGATFVLPQPKGAQCWFRNVAQWEHGELSFEGAAYHLVAIDEDLPLSMLEALQFRAAKCAGKILYCFTSVNGFSPICKNVLTGARVLEHLPMGWEWT